MSSCVSPYRRYQSIPFPGFNSDARGSSESKIIVDAEESTESSERFNISRTINAPLRGIVGRSLFSKFLVFVESSSFMMDIVTKGSPIGNASGDELFSRGNNSRTAECS